MKHDRDPRPRPISELLHEGRTPYGSLFSARDLELLTLTSDNHVIDNLLTPGLNLLAGAPKGGKSFLATAAAFSVARGMVALGERTTRAGDVLYLALEDTQASLKERLTWMAPGGGWPPNLRFDLRWPFLGDGGEDEIERCLDRYPDTRLVVVDVLQRVRRTRPEIPSWYQAEYDDLSRLAGIGRSRDVAILLVHHTRQGREGDAQERVNSSNGLVGVTDANMVLDTSADGTKGKLTVRGKRIPRQKLELVFTDWWWTITGDAEQRPKAAKQAAVPTRDRILGLLTSAGRPLSLPEITEAASPFGISSANVRSCLSRLFEEGKITRPVRGSYAV